MPGNCTERAEQLNPYFNANGVERRDPQRRGEIMLD